MTSRHAAGRAAHCLPAHRGRERQRDCPSPPPTLRADALAPPHRFPRAYTTAARLSPSPSLSLSTPGGRPQRAPVDVGRWRQRLGPERIGPQQEGRSGGRADGRPGAPQGHPVDRGGAPTVPAGPRQIRQGRLALHLAQLRHQPHAHAGGVARAEVLHPAPLDEQRQEEVLHPRHHERKERRQRHRRQRRQRRRGRQQRRWIGRGQVGRRERRLDGCARPRAGGNVAAGRAGAAPVRRRGRGGTAAAGARLRRAADGLPGPGSVRPAILRGLQRQDRQSFQVGHVRALVRAHPNIQTHTNARPALPSRTA